jgi:hypothetical protein
MATPVLSEHARQRCAEMGISTKVAKRIVQNPGITRPTAKYPGCVVIESSVHPQYAVAYCPDANKVITVIFNERNFKARNGPTCLTEGP